MHGNHFDGGNVGWKIDTVFLGRASRKKNRRYLFNFPFFLVFVMAQMKGNNRSMEHNDFLSLTLKIKRPTSFSAEKKKKQKNEYICLKKI